jgi:hypothetical protein
MATTHDPGDGPSPEIPSQQRDDDGPQEQRSGLTRRQLLPLAGGGLVALAAAGAVGYELHPGAKQQPKPAAAKPAAKPKPTPQTTLEKPFVTRPDLSPPEVRITQVATQSTPETTPRFIALAPDYVIENSTPSQQGLMLVDRLGRLVWFKPAAQGQKPFDLKLQTYQGKPVLTWWEGVLVADFGSGKGQIADTTFNTIKTVPGTNGLTMDLHEFTITSSGASLATAYQETTADLTAVRGAKQGRILTCHAQVLDLATGKATFDWNALEHVAVEESYKPVPASGKDLYDYVHVNSLQMLSDGSLIVSARNTWTVYKVNGSTGEIIWRMGGKKSDFQIDAPAQFAWQHHATMLSDTEMTVFDNSTAKQAPSRGLLLSVDQSAMTVSLTQAFNAPTGFYSGTLGSVQLMPNGNVFVGWGTQPYFTEFASDGTQLMFGQLPLGVRSYRAFLVDLVGAPADKPAIVAKAYAAGGYQIYVSWNGATEIDSWRIEAGPNARSLKPVGTSPWTGFETAIVVDAVGPSFQAVALDSNGNELGSSEVV